LENNVETAQKGSWEWGTPGIALGHQAAVLFLKPKTSTQMLQSLLRTKQTENQHSQSMESLLIPEFCSSIYSNNFGFP